jgi:hypothetical protein
MKEIVIMAGTTDPEKKLLTFLETLFPECAVRIVYAGSNREGAHIGGQASGKGIGKAE